MENKVGCWEPTNAAGATGSFWRVHGNPCRPKCVENNRENLEVEDDMLEGPSRKLQRKLEGGRRYMLEEEKKKNEPTLFLSHWTLPC